MTTETLAALATQVPDLVVLLVIVFVFLKQMETRDKSYLDAVKDVTEKLQTMSNTFSTQASSTATAASIAATAADTASRHAEHLGEMVEKILAVVTQPR